MHKKKKLSDDNSSNDNTCITRLDLDCNIKLLYNIFNNASTYVEVVFTKLTNTQYTRSTYAALFP